MSIKGGAKSESLLKQEVWLLVFGVIIGAISILAASQSRDFLDALLQQIVPITEKSLSGWHVVLHRFLFLLLLIAILVIIVVCFA
jgi:hypothetical protein